ncbi:MAG: aldose 1-epimerase family protein [Clostridia bacterium]|nr:aldose 1-epimerase family protein [Clostridia bacterium]
MSEIITISNGIISASINTFGAELISLKKGDFENIWQGNPDIWSGHAPILFPVCGRLRDEKYIYCGREYFLADHGFARCSLFVLEEKGDSWATFLLKSNEKTLEVYPFSFEFRAKFSLVDNTLITEYIITNTHNKEIYFSVGSHEAYACPEGIEEYSLVFDAEENLENSLLTGPLLNHQHDHFGITSELPLKYEYFPERDTLIFEKLKTKNVTLIHRPTGRKIRIDFTGADNLLIWTMDGAKFICIEPWCGLPDFIDTDGDIAKKAGIMTLAPDQTIKKSHTIIF